MYLKDVLLKLNLNFKTKLMFFNIYDGAVSVREYSRSEMLRQQKNIKKVHHKIQYIENRFLHTTDHKKIVHFKAAAKKKRS